MFSSLVSSRYISIHALREEGDLYNSTKSQNGGKFLSTPSARRATVDHHHAAGIDLFLSTPSARRATMGMSQ